MTKNHLKVLAKLGFALCLTLPAALLTVPRAVAADGPDAMYAYFAANGNGVTKIGGTPPTVVYSTNSSIMEMYYGVGAPGNGANVGLAANAYVSFISSGSNSGLCAVFEAPYGVVDTSIGSATCGQSGGTFDLGVTTNAMNTMGGFADAVNTGALFNGYHRYSITLTGGIRSDPTAYLPAVSAVSGTNNLNAVGGYVVPFGTSTIISLDVTPSAGKNVTLEWCEANSQGTPQVQVYGVKAKFGSGLGYFGETLNDASLAWVSPALAANTSTYEPTASTSVIPQIPDWMKFAGGTKNNYSAWNVPIGANAYNGHVVVRVNNYGLGTATETSSNFLNCVVKESGL